MLSWFLGYLFVLPVFKCLNIKNTTIHLNYTTMPESVHFIHLDPIVTCKFQPNGFDCEGTGLLRPKFYYDLKLQDCKSASVGKCPFNLNTFTTLSDCRNICRDVGIHPAPSHLPPRIICRLQYDFGDCDDYHPRWYYDMTARRCRGFSYSGCGGNLNRFSSQQACSAACGGVTERRPDLY